MKVMFQSPPTGLYQYCWSLQLLKLLQPLESSPGQERAVALFAVGAEVAEEERLRRSRQYPAVPGRAGGPEVWEI